MRISPLVLAAGFLQTVVSAPAADHDAAGPGAEATGADVSEVEMAVDLAAAQGPHVHTKCHDVHMFIARGSYEKYDLANNRMDRLLVPAVCKGKKSCGYEDIVYPALIPADYCGGSEEKGVHHGIQQVHKYHKRCPHSKLVLAGYSQGAQVVGDMLGGGGGNTCDAGKKHLHPHKGPGKKIEAVVLFGDTRHTPGQSYNHGSAGKNAVGAFPRYGDQIKQLNKFKPHIRSYCKGADTWCASGGNGQDHASEVETYYKQAAKFIRNKV